MKLKCMNNQLLYCGLEWTFLFNLYFVFTDFIKKYHCQAQISLVYAYMQSVFHQLGKTLLALIKIMGKNKVEQEFL